MTSPPRVPGERLFSLLLWLYPSPFRDKYWHDLLETFRRDRRHPRFSGPVGAVRFWRHTVGDVARTAVSERRGGRQVRTRRSPTRWLQGLRHDFWIAARGLATQPGYTAVAILTLGLGVGATTAVFAVVHGVLLRPLPWADADRLVRVYELERQDPGARMVAYGNYADLREEARGLEELAIWAYQGATLTGEGPATRLAAPQTSAGFARVFHETPLLGRWFTEEEADVDAAVVVLGHGLWQDAFGADRAVVGRTIHLDGRPMAVIGVMGPGFWYPGDADVWRPLPPVRDPVGRRRWHRHSMIGRLAEDETLERLNTEVAAIAVRLEALYPDYNRDNYFEARSLLADMVGSRRQSLLVLFGAVAVLLLIACVNVASLSLARAVSRGHEMAIRSALGASSWRLARLVLAESLLVGATGSLIALALAALGVRELMLMAGDTVPRAGAVTATSPTVQVFGISASLLAGLAAALPALASGRETAAMTSHGTRGSSSRAVMRGRRGLVLAQLTAAFILTTGAGLLIKSVAGLQAIDSGVRPDRVQTFRIGLPALEYGDPAAVARFIDALMERVEQVPDVERAAVTLTPPVDPYGWYNSLTIRGRAVAIPDLPSVSYVVASAGYFDTMSIPVIAGRTYDIGEPRGEPVAVINETAARRFWPGEDPIGKLILGTADDDTSWTRIIGVVGDVRQALDAPIQPEVYVPLAQEQVLDFVVAIRTRLDDPGAVMPAVRDLVADADPDVPVTSVMSLPARIAQTTAAPTFNAVLMAVFAGTALLLAACGVFAMVSFSVAARRREFGIRVAVGASRPRIFLHVLGANVRLAAGAIGIGLVGVQLGGRAIEGLLFGVGTADAATMAAVAAVIGAVAVTAGLWPARVATSADPLAALRSD